MFDNICYWKNLFIDFYCDIDIPCKENSLWKVAVTDAYKVFKSMINLISEGENQSYVYAFHSKI